MGMKILRLLIVMLIVTACKTGEIACPDPKFAKLRKRPANYQRRIQSNSLSASAQQEKEKPQFDFRQTRPVKSAADIEEWDCPKPGQRNAVPKAVKENIRKNRKKFETYYRTREFLDSVSSAGASKPR
jgi:hypothetical protein